LRLVVDTSVLIGLRNGDAAVRRALEERRHSADEVGMSRLTQYELLLGAEFLWKKYGDAREVAWLDGISDWLSVYEADAEVVKTAAAVQAEALLGGSPVPDMDVFIAVSGKAGSELLTTDEDQLAMKDALESRGITVSQPRGAD
jgi:predicted nucleic acid-binding protein